MNIEFVLSMIAVLLVMAWAWRYRNNENRRLRDKVEYWKQLCADTRAEVAAEKLKRELLELELGASEDAAAQDVELWR